MVEAYDRIVAAFPDIRAARQAYCDAIDRLIVANLPPGAGSLLDAGAADGARAEKIAQSASIGEVVLLEPSSGMRGLIHTPREVWTDRLEELSPTERRFEVIVCLWNVLGHIATPEKRLRALENMRSLLSPQGLLFLDVTNRYNARAYGRAATFGRLLYDTLHPSFHNGDVTVRWRNRDMQVVTYGHVFTPREIRKLIANARLNIRKIDYVDYTTGEIRSSRFGGNMFFVLSH